MRHLTVEELIDIAEAERSENEAPHLTVCADCRGRVSDLRTALRTAASVEVPEPSPLFWDHFSARVSEAVTAERDRKLRSTRWLRILVPAALAAAAAVAIVIAVRSQALPRATRPADNVAVRSIDPSAEPTSELLNDASTPDDASLSLVGDLAAAIDLDAAFEAGMTPRGTAEHAVTHLNIDELRELQRLLRHELGVI